MRRFLRALACVALACAALLPAAGAAQNFLWQVSSPTNRVYLFGTIHAGKATWYPLPRAVDQAFGDSNELVVEADVTDEKAMSKSASSMAYAPPDSLGNHVPKEDYARFLRLLPNYRFSEAEVGQMKPFMAVSLLVFAEWARLGYLPRLGVDGYLIRRAKAELKPVVELEGVDAQLALMDSLTEAENRALFAGTLGALESGLTDRQIQGMVHAWQVGDPNEMLEVARRYNEQVNGAAEFEEKFVWSRHPAMVEKIAAWLNGPDRRRFIAVGALHLCGPRGLVELLRARGFAVRQIFVAPPGEKKDE
jgi:uncharacterized protein YbaP (TraB family)